MKRSWLARHPVGFMALYSIFYLSVFHYLEANVPLRSILVHCRLDDLIPFNEWFIFPYGSWFFLLCGSHSPCSICCGRPRGRTSGGCACRCSPA